VSITLSTTSHPDRFEGRIETGLDRYEVREQIRGTDITVAVHERFGDPGEAQRYADQRTTQEPAMYGPDAAHKLAVEDVVWGHNPVRRWSR
jgi:hypothetical protein